MKVVHGIITSKYGYRKHPITGKHHHHNGIDIAAPIGTPIFTPVTGQVVSIGGDQWNGNQVRIQSELHTFIFLHLHSFAVKPGQHVIKGQNIATVGATGQVTGAHLHFEVHTSHIPINPEPYITF